MGRYGVRSTPGRTARSAARFTALAVLGAACAAHAAAAASATSAPAAPASSAADSSAVAAVHLELARSLLQQRQYTDARLEHSTSEALRLLEQLPNAPAIQLADAHRLAAWHLFGRGAADPEMLHPARRAIDIARASADTTTDIVPAALRFVGVHFEVGGEMDSAGAAYREAVAVRERADFPRDRAVGTLRLDLARLATLRGDFDEARAEQRLALDAMTTRMGAGDPAVADVYQGMGNLEWEAGDFAKSADFKRRALEIIQRDPSVDPLDLASARSGLAWPLYSLGDVDEARRLFELAIPVVEERFGPTHPRSLHLGITYVHLLTAVDDSSLVLAQCRKLRALWDADSALAATDLPATVAFLEAEIVGAHDPQAALDILGSVPLEPSPVSPLRLVLQHDGVARALHAALGRWDEVDRLEQRIRERLADPVIRGSADEVWSRERLAGMNRVRGRPGAAFDELAAASRISRDVLLRNLRILSDRDGLRLSANRVPPLAALLDVARVSLPDSARAAWDEVVRWRGRVTAEIASRRPPPGIDLQGDAARAFDAWVHAKGRLAREEVQAANAGFPEERAPELKRLQDELREAEAGWARASGSEVERAADDPGLGAVLEALRPGEALVAFAIAGDEEEAQGPRHVVAFAARGAAVDEAAGASEISAARGASSVRTIDLGPVDALREAGDAWRAEASRSPRGRAGADSACLAAGRKLRALAWDPLAEFVGGAAALYVVPEGPMHRVSWEALPGEDGHPLAETGPTIHVLDAERDLLRPALPARGERILAFGGADFGAAPADLAAPRSAAPQFGPLPGTREELLALTRLFPETKSITGSDASERAFKERASGHRVLHIATHGFVASEDSPLPLSGSRTAGRRGVGGVAPVENEKPAPDAPPRSKERHRARSPSPWMGRRTFLALAGANRARLHTADENEGWLTADEVSTLNLAGTEWVVLSACHSGTADSWTSEGVLGMRRAFRLAGARAVIAADWDVDDVATKNWMTALYEARRAGTLDASEAVRAANRATLAARRARGESVHPFYWAAFTASGD